jgi:hypothetical protein
MVFFLVALSVAASTAAASPTLSVDLDGDGSAETVTAVPARRGVRIEVRSGAGKKLATVDAPSPRSDGSPVISLSSGSLGKSGSLLEVVAATETEECRSVWRLAKGALVRVPVATGETPAPDCGPAREWTSSWDAASSTSAPDGADIYRRERSRETPKGRLHQVEWFRYTTFRLERDPERSSAEIGGVTIPNWSPVYMYPKPALEILYARFGLEPFKTGPRLRWRADLSTGVFQLEVERAGRTESFDVAAIGPGEQRNDYLVRVRFAEGERQVRTSLIGQSNIPYETVLSGVRPDLDGLYTPPVHLLENGLQVFRSAEEEIASNSLAGAWAGRKGEVIKFTFRPGETRVLIGEHAYLLDIRSAPSGLDLVAVSGDGGPPVGFRLLGPNALERAPIRCDAGGSGFNGCRVSGAAERFHRVGARLNTR